jgi:hypothetical protein
MAVEDYSETINLTEQSKDIVSEASNMVIDDSRFCALAVDYLMHISPLNALKMMKEEDPLIMCPRNCDGPVTNFSKSRRIGKFKLPSIPVGRECENTI